MRNAQLIRFLSALFLIVYRSTIWIGVLVLLFSSTLWQEVAWWWELQKHNLPANGSHVIYDTSANAKRGDKYITMLHTRSKLFPYEIQKQGDNYTAIDTTGHSVWIKHESELLEEPDSIQRIIESAEQVAKRRQKAEIDSVLLANPDAYIIERKYRYDILEPSFSSSFILPMDGGVGPVPKQQNLSKKWSYNNGAEKWQYLLGTFPLIKVRRESSNRMDDYYLWFEYRTWNQLKAIPIGVILLGRLPFIIWWIASLIGAYQLKRLFEDLSESKYFNKQQTARISRIGWAMILYFILNLIVINAQNMYAQNYFTQHNFYTYDGFIPRFPDNWSLIVTGLILLVVRQVFEYGRQLEEESELTI